MNKAKDIGISIPEPIGAAEIRRWGGWTRGFLLMTGIPDATDLSVLSEEKNPSAHSRANIRNAAARSLADVHRKGFVHDDLNAEHVLVSNQGDKISVYYIDLAGARFPEKIRMWQRVKNLAQLEKSLAQERVSQWERLRFLLHYAHYSDLDEMETRYLIRKVREIAELKSNEPDNLRRRIIWLWKSFISRQSG